MFIGKVTSVIQCKLLSVTWLTEVFILHIFYWVPRVRAPSPGQSCETVYLGLPVFLGPQCSNECLQGRSVPLPPLLKQTLQGSTGFSSFSGSGSLTTPFLDFLFMVPPCLVLLHPLLNILFMAPLELFSSLPLLANLFKVSLFLVSSQPLVKRRQFLLECFPL